MFYLLVRSSIIVVYFGGSIVEFLKFNLAWVLGQWSYRVVHLGFVEGLDSRVWRVGDGEPSMFN